MSVIRSDVNRNVLRVTKFAVNVALFAFIRIGRIVPACLLLDVAVIYPFDGIAEGLHRLKREVDDLVPRVANAGANGWDPDLVWVFENATALPAIVVQRLRRSPSRR